MRIEGFRSNDVDEDALGMLCNTLRTGPADDFTRFSDFEIWR